VGFITYHGMTAEQVIWAWVKSELLTPKRLAYFPPNLYHDAISNPVKDKRGKGKDVRRAVGAHVKDA
jgi:hypothetical protein